MQSHRKLLRKAAFTLTEVIVSLGIIAVLMGLGIYGIRLLQENGRDTQRLTKLAEIKLEIDNYYRVKARYPVVGTDFVWGTTSVTIANKTLALPGVLTRVTGTASSFQNTAYYYSIQPDGILLCVDRERGSWYSLSSSKASCP